ncbi:MAG: sigma 54-interacting transcriptional regulator [Bacteriovoracaceae bacterium]|nr:sigma 54-interacting transcriptional regulator [Bacteriovoracaceae bacterium]
MLASFSEFKFYQSFRIPVEDADDLRFLVQISRDRAPLEYINDAKLLDISLTGLGFATAERISVGKELTISLQFKKHHLDLTGKVVRAFSQTLDDQKIIYGLEIDEDKSISKFLEHYILGFSSERLKNCLVDSAIKERYTKATDGFEIFSLLLSLFKDITHFGDKEGFIESMLEEVIRILNAQRASLFLINPETNELEAICALGIRKEQLKFDYRVGIAGSVFTTGVALNIDTVHDSTRFNEAFDKKYGFETRSIICHPIHNREDKIIGVIEVLNKRNEDRFTIEDEKTMKVLSLIFSSAFYNFTPMSDKSLIRRFSNPFDRKNAFIGRVPHVASLRSTIVKLKDIEAPVLISGERGVGKSLYAKILHIEGQRGLKGFEIVHCSDKDQDAVGKMLFGPDEKECKLITCQGGTVHLHEIWGLSLKHQKALMEVFKTRHITDTKFTLDVRIIATSTRDLGLLASNGEFDRELYEHLSKATVFMEPLRRRADDIELLVDYFLKAECKKEGLLLKAFAPKLMEKLKKYDWPGNVKELRLCVERAVLYNPKTHIITDIEIEDSASPLVDLSEKKRMFGDLPFVSDHNISLKDRMSLVEREMIHSEIRRCNGNKSKAAKAMGISREALRKKLLMSTDILKSLNLSEDERLKFMKEDDEFLSAA